MASQEVQHRIKRKASLIIYPPKISIGHHRPGRCEHSLRMRSPPETNHKSRFMASGETFSARKASKSSLSTPHTNSSPTLLGQLPQRGTTEKNVIGYSQAGNAAVITASPSPQVRSINGIRHLSLGSQQQQQRLPSLCRGTVSLLPIQRSETYAICYKPMLQCDKTDRGNVSLGKCCVSPQGVAQSSGKVLDDGNRHPHPSERAPTSISLVAATIAAGETGGLSMVEASSPPSLPRTCQREETTARTQRHTCSDSDSTLRVVVEQKELKEICTAPQSDTVAGSGVRGRSAVEGDTAWRLHPHPPSTSAPFPCRRRSVIETKRQSQPPLSPHASEALSDSLKAAEDSMLAASSCHSPLISVADGASEERDWPRMLRSPRSVSSDHVDTENDGEGAGGGWHSLPAPALWGLPRSPVYSILASKGEEEGDRYADTFANVSQTLCRPASDSECHLSERITDCHLACSVSASKGSHHMLPFIDLPPKCKRKQSAAEYTIPGVVRRHPVSLSSASSLTSLGTSLDTRNLKESIRGRCVSASAGGLRARTQPLSLETPPTHASRKYSAYDPFSSKRSAGISLDRPVGATPPKDVPAPALCFSLLTAGSDLDSDLRTGDNSVQASKASFLVTPRAIHHPVAEPSHWVPSSGDSREELVLRAPGAVAAATAKGRGCVAPLVTLLAVSGNTFGASPCSVGGATAKTASPSATAELALKEDKGAELRHRGAYRYVRRTGEISSLRSTSVPSMRSSFIGHSTRGRVSYSSRGRYGEHGYCNAQYSAGVSGPPFVSNAQTLSTGSCTVRGLGGWVHEAAVDAPLDVLSSGMTSLVSITDRHFHTTDSSVCGDSDSSHAIPANLLLSSNTSYRPRLGLIAAAKCYGGISQLRRPLPPSLSAPTLLTTSSNVSLNRAMYVDSTPRSAPEWRKSGSGVTAATIAVSSFNRSTVDPHVLGAGESSAYGDIDESAVVGERTVSFTPPQEDTCVTSNGIEGMQLGCSRAVDSILAHPDAPPFAKAAFQRLHGRHLSQHQRSELLTSHFVPGVTPRGCEDALEKVPIPAAAATTTSRATSVVHSHTSTSHSRNSQSQSCSADKVEHRAKDEGDFVSSTVSNDQVRTGKLKVSVVPQPHQGCRHTLDGHTHAKVGPRTATAFSNTTEAIILPQSNALMSRGLLGSSDGIDADAPTGSCLAATEVHLPRLLSVARPGRSVFTKYLFGL